MIYNPASYVEIALVTCLSLDCHATGEGQAGDHEGPRRAGRTPLSAVQGLHGTAREVDDTRHVPRAWSVNLHTKKCLLHLLY